MITEQQALDALRALELLTKQTDAPVTARVAVDTVRGYIRQGSSPTDAIASTGNTTHIPRPYR